MRIENCSKKIKTKIVFGSLQENPVELSIVIPTYRRQDLLKKNLRAIDEQIKTDTKIGIEVIVVSNDPSFQIESLDIELDPSIYAIYVNEENLGMCGNMNKCAQIAKGKYISYIQDDDVLLPNYINEISKLIQSDMLKEIDCLIPNRYYLMPETDKKTQFGNKAIRNMRAKRIIGSVLRMGKPIPMFQQIKPYDTLITTYPFYSGGPTCGMLFHREKLINFGGFDTKHPYGFDYAFFMDYSQTHVVMLYDVFLALYMTADSASKRSEVQADFYKVRNEYLEKYWRVYGISEKRKRTLELLNDYSYPEAASKEHGNENGIIDWIIVKAYSIWARLVVYRSGGYRRKECPKEIEEWYLSL